MGAKFQRCRFQHELLVQDIRLYLLFLKGVCRRKAPAFYLLVSLILNHSYVQKVIDFICYFHFLWTLIKKKNFVACISCFFFKIYEASHKSSGAFRSVNKVLSFIKYDIADIAIAYIFVLHDGNAMLQVC